jgi:hypothetical protein
MAAIMAFAAMVALLGLQPGVQQDPQEEAADPSNSMDMPIHEQPSS